MVKEGALRAVHVNRHNRHPINNPYSSCFLEQPPGEQSNHGTEAVVAWTGFVLFVFYDFFFYMPKFECAYV